MSRQKTDRMKESLIEDNSSTSDEYYGTISDTISSPDRHQQTDSSCNCQRQCSPVLIVTIVSAALLIVELTAGTILTVTTDLLHETAAGNQTSPDDQQIAVKIGTTQSAYHFGLIIGNILCGRLTYKYGYVNPFWCGLITGLVATLVSVFPIYWWILAASYSLIGVSVAFILNSGLTMVSVAYDRNPDTRIIALAIIYSCRFSGAAVGYSVCLYVIQSIGRSAPFWILFSALGLTTIIRAAVRIDNNRSDDAMNSDAIEKPFQLSLVKAMLTDPQTLILLGFNTIADVYCSVYFSLVPFWIIEHVATDYWQLATVRLTSAILFVFSTNIFGCIVSKTRSHRWIYGLIYCLLAATSAFTYPFIGNIWQACIPDGLCTLAFSLLGAFFHSWLSDITDQKFHGNYETLFAVDLLMCRVTSIVLTILAGAVQPFVGYPAILITLGVIHFCYMFTSLALRDL
ncbi:chromaffin granule amine transporter-like [Tubulanus polymorphus]|uniref:chromaffin granule amine transporter-like n=1 Tax=Tubulanus polymorphus TaxID=672921 RepID=UPI003DA47D87